MHRTAVMFQTALTHEPTGAASQPLTKFTLKHGAPPLLDDLLLSFIIHSCWKMGVVGTNAFIYAGQGSATQSCGETRPDFISSK